MKKASDKAYISKRTLEIYQRERERLQKLSQEEESKRGELDKKLQDISEEENLSAEEVDSDDLGEEIT